MLLTAILFGLVYQAFTIIHTNYTSYNKNNTLILNIQSLSHQLQQDFDQAKIVIADINNVSCVSQNKQVEYLFIEDGVVRNQGEIVDTFYCETDELKFYFQKNEIHPSDQLIDRLVFSCELKGEQLNLDIAKEYAVDILMADNKEWKGKSF